MVRPDHKHSECAPSASGPPVTSDCAALCRIGRKANCFMARPRKPLISRRSALEAALHIIDDEGLDRLSMRRLGDYLGVNGASLYHHFTNKEDILVGAAQLALAGVTPNSVSETPWRVWLPEMAGRYRDALAAHPALVPIALQRRKLGFGLLELEESATRLLDEGVPSAAVIPLLHAIELFIVGSALHQTDTRFDGGTFLPSTPRVATIFQDTGLSAEEIFQLVIESIIRGIENAIDQQIARWTPSRVELGPLAAVRGPDLTNHARSPSG